MLGINYEDSLDVISYGSNIAVVLYGDNLTSEGTTRALEICDDKFKSFQNIKYFYEMENTSWEESLSHGAFKKRKFEIDNKMDFHFIIAINVRKVSVFGMPIVDLHNVQCSDFSLYYFSGSFNTHNWKTAIDDSGFYCISRIFDVVSNFVNVKEKIQKLACDDKSFGDASREHAFYYYLKTLNLQTYCVNPLAFKKIKE